MNWYYEPERVYSTDEKGKLIAETTFFQKEDGVINIDHTYVSPNLRGKGVGANMMAVVAEHLRDKGKRVTASCSYANLWFKKNKEANADIISDDMSNEPLACNINEKHG